MKKIIFIFVGVLLVIIGLIIYLKVVNQDYVTPKENLTVISDTFENGEILPVQYTGYGEDISPNIELESIDPKGKSIAIIMDDLDAPIGVLNHWVIWNIPVKYMSIPSGVERKTIVESLDGAIQGMNGYGGKHYYRGPKPPSGTHRYIFKVYVLDKMLSIDEDSKKRDFQKAIEGHILQYGTIEANVSHSNK
jgi:Raf kinase inhibitor-like YbhB/YbcL family protein